MKLKDIVAVSGMQGLYKILATRDNGIIVEDFDTGKRTFASARKHQITPMETVAIYTYEDTVEIRKVFETMMTGETEIPDANAPAADLHAFFRKIVKNYDEDNVFLGDIKKVIRWYRFLEAHDLLAGQDEEE